MFHKRYELPFPEYGIEIEIEAIRKAQFHPGDPGRSSEAQASHYRPLTGLTEAVTKVYFHERLTLNGDLTWRI